MINKALIKKVRKVWKKAKKDGSCEFDDVEYAIHKAGVTEYQRGYLAAKLEEIGNCLSSESEDWLWEVEKVLGYFVEED